MITFNCLLVRIHHVYSSDKKNVVVVFAARENKQNPIQGGGRFGMGRGKGTNQGFWFVFTNPLWFSRVFWLFMLLMFCCFCFKKKAMLGFLFDRSCGGSVRGNGVIDYTFGGFIWFQLSFLSVLKF